jgi:tryptophan-rich sensory protein
MPGIVDSSRTEQGVDVGQTHFAVVGSAMLRWRRIRKGRGPFFGANDMKSKSMARLALSLLLCLAVGTLEGLVTRPEIPAWYAGLAKPSWTPPPLAFPIAWTILYVLMAFSLWRLWDLQTRSAARTRAMIWFLIQLALNALWSPVFFGWHGTRTALVIIVALLIAIAATMLTASRVDRLAAWLLAPYLLWVAYATTLNAGVVTMN